MKHVNSTLHADRKLMKYLNLINRRFSRSKWVNRLRKSRKIITYYERSRLKLVHGIILQFTSKIEENNAHKIVKSFCKNQIELLQATSS